MSSSPINHLIAVLKFPKKISDFIIYSKAIVKAMTGNANFPGSANKLASLVTSITALDTAETALNTKPPTVTTATRNVALDAVKVILRSLLADVQVAANANPASSEAIILSAAVSVKKQTIRGKQQSDVEDGEEEGSVLLTGEGAGAHQWQQSPDDGVTIINLDPTLTAQTTVSGLPSNVKLWFRNRQILPNNLYGSWSAWMSIQVP